MRTSVRKRDTGHTGEFENSFHLLTKDYSSLRLNPFRKFMGDQAPPQAELAKRLGVSRGQVYKDELRLPPAFIQTKIIPIAMAAELAAELLGTLEQGRLWMLTPNAYFFGQSPFNLCLIGKGDHVLSLLMSRLGRLPDAHT